MSFFWIDRYYWDSTDPYIICESIFAVANVLSFARGLYIMAVDDALGPLQLTLGQMLKVGGL